MKTYNLVIVGGGPAGIAAAISAHEAGIKDILILERDISLGGILNQCIHTGFGLEYFKEILTGPEYAARFIKKVEDAPDIEVSLSSFVVDLAKDKTLTFIKPGVLKRVRARSLIMATGCREKTREMIHIPGLRPAGIFSAGLAQKLINIEGLLPGTRVVVVGSGDIGLIMARRFTLEGADVKAIVEVREKASGLVRNVAQCVTDFGIPLYFNHKVSRIYGKDRVEAVDITRLDGEKGFRVECDTLLVSVGLIPENELIETAGVKNAADMSIPGLFVCGNSFKVYDIVDSVTKDSEITGRKAAEWLKKT